jgi:uridine kinase
LYKDRPSSKEVCVNDIFIIAVAGGSGSGKTFFAETLTKKLGPDVAGLIYQDNYYIDQSDRFDGDGGSVNFDHPDALDFELMAAQLAELKEGLDIEIPLYDFATHKRRLQTKTQPAKKVIIVDGILILTQPKLRELFDIAIFVETPEEIRFMRRLKRDVLERGRTEEGVKAQFSKQVKPMHDMFVEPSKVYADIVSSGTDIESLYRLLKVVQKKIFAPKPMFNPTYSVSLENSLP